uniref:Uncharacterized protein n=1 Tax=Arundo donax TaxID=35708 RepID=A0A0A9FXB8_ARUDO
MAAGTYKQPIHNLNSILVPTNPKVCTSETNNVAKSNTVIVI